MVGFLKFMFLKYLSIRLFWFLGVCNCVVGMVVGGGSFMLNIGCVIGCIRKVGLNM